MYERKDWRVSGWALELQELAVEGLTPSSRSARRFRKDFRIPYPFFLELVAHVKEKGGFQLRRRMRQGVHASQLSIRSEMSYWFTAVLLYCCTAVLQLLYCFTPA